ncbi:MULTISPECIES: LysR family transcriptional regulator [unclassified Agarivorans]|uniref:LysR family transcriptional regulator n=1 Tax=unclassified Agarivorans TaxID=2636026 RepID=UPI0026E2B64C|nr:MULTISPECIES: LysR family transcriptional regulator [unclassified Agarivorans]MDO6687220.1 LysR family transcriptional regulator [Agarivorans sp. 3_MG-2023]MDO6716853.1 LysR family transcriptional regulator [Agarivorans sp. 2_MG-2023]
MDWRSINFDWNRARAFLVTAEEGSLSAAARALNMTQPTLGRQVSALEQELGVSLFERVSGRLQLTGSGLELLAHVKAMGDAANSLSLSASGRAEAIEGDVCISASEAVAAYILPPIIAKLRDHAPGIRVEIIASNDSSDLLRREADIAIRAYQPKELELIARKLKDINVHMYAARAYLQQWPQPRTITSLAKADFLGFSKSDELIDELSKSGFALEQSNFPVSVSNHLVQWELVKQGLGIGFMLENVGDSEPLVERAFADLPAFATPSWLVVHRELNTSRRLRMVYDFLAKHLN